MEIHVMNALRAGLIAGALLLAAGAHAVPEKKTEPTFKNLGHIHGYLIAPSGQGLRGMVALADESGRTLSLHPSFAIRKGRFDIDNLLPGTYVLRAQTVGPEATDLVPGPPMSVTVKRGTVHRPRLVAQTAPRVSGVTGGTPSR
jgi:hypothetical protein